MFIIKPFYYSVAVCYYMTTIFLMNRMHEVTAQSQLKFMHIVLALKLSPVSAQLIQQLASAKAVSH